MLKKGDLEQEMFPDLRDISPHLLKKYNIFLRFLQVESQMRFIFFFFE